MKINLPYSPGHTFWSPRVLSRNTPITIVHDGHEYSRYDDTLEISARNKRIVRVEIAVKEHGEPAFKYWGATIGNDKEWPSLVDPESGFPTEQAALDFARHWRDTNQTEYCGPWGMDDPDE